VSITALRQEVGFSLDAGALKKCPSSRPFLFSQVFATGPPTPQSGDPRRSPKIRLRRNRGASLWSAVSITALTQEVGFSQAADSFKKCPSSRPFLFSHVFLTGPPTPQSGDPRRSPKFRLRRNRGASLWSAVSITALMQEVSFSQDADSLKKVSEVTPFFIFPCLPHRSAHTPKRRSSQQSKVPPETKPRLSLWSAVSITALMQEVGFSQDADSLKKCPCSRPFLFSQVCPTGPPTPQSGDPRRSPKFRLRRNRGASLRHPDLPTWTMDLGGAPRKHDEPCRGPLRIGCRGP